MANINDDLNEIPNCRDINNFITKIHTNTPINLLCMHINIRSTIKNFSSVEQIIHSSSQTIDVIILTEANIKEFLSAMYSLKGYNMYTELRKNRKGGGIIVYVNKKHKFTINNIKTKYFESITGQITTSQNYSATLCAIYRPPDLSKHLFVDELDTLLKRFTTKDDIYILGDINIDQKSNCPVKNKYSTVMYNHGLVGGISQYTRIEIRKNKITKSCIDHIYARSLSQDLYTTTLGTVLADHRAIALACVGPIQLQDGPKFITKYDTNKLITSLEKIEWKSSDNIFCPYKLYKLIVDNIKKCYKKSEIQIKMSKNTKRSENGKWVNKKIINACEHRDKLFISWIKDINNKIIKTEYNKARNYANNLIIRSKNKHIKNEINSNKNNPKALWSILNNITGRIKVSIDNIILNAFENNTTTISNIANNFAETFSKSVKDIVPKCNIKLLQKSAYTTPANLSLRFQLATPRSVLKIINTLDSKKAPGFDGVRTTDLKIIGKQVAGPIANLINTSVAQGVYPMDLKTGIVRPIYKKGSRKEYGNYRPITILPTIDKIIEKYISKTIHTFYEDNHILTNTQYGFQRGKSTTQLLETFTDTIYQNLNDKKHILIVFIDYSKAFDTLQHNTLLDKLDDCGIRGPLKNWCRDYLTDRSYTVKVANTYSNQVTVSEGTAQGSVLGPLHYISYVNDVVNLIENCKIYQFADDTCLIAAHDNIQVALNQLQTDFTLLTKWSHDSGLVLNAEKTKLMYISSSANRTEHDLKLVAHEHACLHSPGKTCNCKCVELVNKQRYLGLIIDDRLKWTDHINFVCDKLRSILAKLSIVKYKIPYTTLLLFYKALGESTIYYGLSSYGRTCKSHLDPIYQLQIRILKTIVPAKIRVKYRNTYQNLFPFCKILPVYELVKFSLLVDNYFKTDHQNLVQHQNNRITRSIIKGRLRLPKYNNLYGRQLLKYQIPNLLNNLPPNFKKTISEENIKYKLKEHYLSLIT